MIGSLSGVVEEAGLDSAVVDVNGVGYRVFLSLKTLAKMPTPGQRVKLRIRTVVREDALDLYGFLSPTEEELFLLLTSVSHVGPKMALTVMSGMEAEELAFAIQHGEVGRLTKLHGVGKKTAERLVMELKDKVAALTLGKKVARAAGEAPPPPSSGVRADLVSALVNMGYKPALAEKAADVAEERAGKDAGLDVLIREALRAARS